MMMMMMNVNKLLTTGVQGAFPMNLSSALRGRNCIRNMGLMKRGFIER
jgi:hypothetical protein